MAGGVDESEVAWPAQPESRGQSQTCRHAREDPTLTPSGRIIYLHAYLNISLKKIKDYVSSETHRIDSLDLPLSNHHTLYTVN